MPLPERQYLKRLANKRIHKLEKFLAGKGKYLRPFERRYYERKLARWKERAEIAKSWTNES